MMAHYNCTYYAERNILVITFAGAVVYGMLLRNVNISYTGYIVPGVPAFRAPNFTILTNIGNDTHQLSNIASVSRYSFELILVYN